MMTMLCQVTWLDPSKRTMFFFVNMKYSHWRSWVYEHIISYPYWASSIIFLSKVFCLNQPIFCVGWAHGSGHSGVGIDDEQMTITTEEPGFFLPPPEMHKLPYDGSFGGDNLGFWKLVWRQKRSCGRVKHFIARGFSTFFCTQKLRFSNQTA